MAEGDEDGPGPDDAGDEGLISRFWKSPVPVPPPSESPPAPAEPETG